MSITINLPPYVETYLQAEAAKQETAVEEYAARLLEDVVPERPLPKTGAEIVARLEEEGIIGMWADREDMKDSTEYVNRLRQKIQTDWQRE